jgi:hypothetical protein
MFSTSNAAFVCAQGVVVFASTALSKKNKVPFTNEDIMEALTTITRIMEEGANLTTCHRELSALCWEPLLPGNSCVVMVFTGLMSSEP